MAMVVIADDQGQGIMELMRSIKSPAHEAEAGDEGNIVCTQQSQIWSAIHI
jgi:hypothetical protein